MMAATVLRRALALYPQDFRARFEKEMAETMACSLASPSRRLGRAIQVVREVGSVCRGAAAEWAAKAIADPVERARALPDCRLMRPVGVTRAEWAAGLKHVTLRDVDQ